VYSQLVPSLCGLILFNETVIWVFTSQYIKLANSNFFLYRIFVFVILAVPECKKRWKGLRDRYVRNKKELKLSQKSGAGAVASGKIDNEIMKKLDFLQPFVDTRQ